MNEFYLCRLSSISPLNIVNLIGSTEEDRRLHKHHLDIIRMFNCVLFLHIYMLVYAGTPRGRSSLSKIVYTGTPRGRNSVHPTILKD